MPIQVNQLVIRTTVVDEGKEQAGGEKMGRSESKNGKKSQHQEIVADCIEQVMEILREQKER
jgi:hypothetical protein